MDSINIHQLTKSYFDENNVIDALGPISLKIDQGEFVCLLGESGCGKSTLWKILAGLEESTSGSISIDGEAVHGPSSKRGVVFQNHGLLPWLTVKQNISLGYQIRGEKVPNHKINYVMKSWSMCKCSSSTSSSC